MRRALLAGVALALGAMATSGCAPARPPPPRAPALATAADALPPDLDLIIRVDLAKVRVALGPNGMDLVRQGTGAPASDPSSELVARALERTTLAYLALRPELIPGAADNVLVLHGSYADLGVDRLLEKSGWAPGVDLGGDVRRFDRRGAVERAAPARIYVFGTEQLIFVSAAEIDSVEAVVERQLPPTRLRPREQGVLAFAARLRALRYGLAERYPSLARAIGDAAGFEGTLDSSPTGLKLEVSFEMPTEVAAQQAADALAAVREVLSKSESKAGILAKGANAEAIGQYVVVRLALERGLL